MQLEKGCKRTRDIVRKKYGTWPHCHSLSTDWHRHWSGWARYIMRLYIQTSDATSLAGDKKRSANHKIQEANDENPLRDQPP